MTLRHPAQRARLVLPCLSLCDLVLKNCPEGWLRKSSMPGHGQWAKYHVRPPLPQLESLLPPWTLSQPLFFFLFSSVPCGLRDLSSLDQGSNLCSLPWTEVYRLHHWTGRESFQPLWSTPGCGLNCIPLPGPRTRSSFQSPRLRPLLAVLWTYYSALRPAPCFIVSFVFRSSLVDFLLLDSEPVDLVQPLLPPDPPELQPARPTCLRGVLLSAAHLRPRDSRGVWVPDPAFLPQPGTQPFLVLRSQMPTTVRNMQPNRENRGFLESNGFRTWDVADVWEAHKALLFTPVLFLRFFSAEARSGINKVGGCAVVESSQPSSHKRPSTSSWAPLSLPRFPLNLLFFSVN